MTEKREDDMSVNKEQSVQPVVMKNEDILKLAKKGMSKYREALDKLAKN